MFINMPLPASIQDNGIGFDPHNLNTAGRSPFGLLGMSERASLLGGSVNVNSRLGSGTLVEVAFPFTEQAEREDV